MLLFCLFTSVLFWRRCLTSTQHCWIYWTTLESLFNRFEKNVMAYAHEYALQYFHTSIHVLDSWHVHVISGCDEIKVRVFGYFSERLSCISKLCFNVKMPSYQWLSYIYHGNWHTWKDGHYIETRIWIHVRTFHDSSLIPHAVITGIIIPDNCLYQNSFIKCWYHLFLVWLFILLYL